MWYEMNKSECKSINQGPFYVEYALANVEWFGKLRCLLCGLKIFLGFAVHKSNA